MNKFKEINWNPDKVELRKFGRVLLIGLPFTSLAWFCIVRYITHDRWIPEVPFWILAIGIPIAISTLIAPPIGRQFYRVWFFLICVIETIIVHVLFTILYYGLMAPFGFFIRRKSETPMQNSINKELKTYWKDAEQVTDPKRYFRQF